jgi:alpha-glucosidase
MAPRRRLSGQRVEEVRRDGRTVLAELGGPRLGITVLGDRLLRIRWSPSGAFRERRPWAVTPPDEDFPESDFEVTEGRDGHEIRTPGLTVALGSDGALAVRSPDGRDILRDAGGPRFDPEGATTSWSLAMPHDRRYFGFGERTGLLEKRGRRYTCWTTDEWHHQGPMTDALYIAVPFHLALDRDGLAHGIFLDTTYRSAFDLRALEAEKLIMEAESPGLDWYLFLGPTPRDVVSTFTGLVGRPALPPRWALGYHQARWSYRSAQEVLDVARRLRAERIPADVVHLDIDHMDRFRPFTWDSGRFPDPGALVRELATLDLRATLVVDAPVPITDGYAVFEEGRERGAFVRASHRPGAELVSGWLWGGRSAYPDHLRPEVRAWWGGLHRPYVDLGIAGILNDMNEPAMRDGPMDAAESDNTEPPPDTPFGDPGLNATHAEVRNLYANAMNRATADFLRAARPEARPFVVSRAGFAGLQRDAIAWTGDNWSAWEHLEMSLPQLLNLGLSGIPIAGADIGGFLDGCTPELLVRWSQLGALYPFARNNSAKGTPRQEPWAWGEPTTSRCRRAIELRYRLLPYLYTAVEEASRTGTPVLRPLFLEFPEDAGCQVVGDEAMLGDALLVAPVVRPGASSRSVYLPPGDWFDLRAGRRRAGGRAILASAGLDEDVPLFARSGSIVPMTPVVQSTSERPGRLEVHVFPTRGGAASGTVYEDDGESTAYLAGSVARTRSVARRSGRGVEVRGERAGGFDPGPRTVEVIVHGGARPRSGEVPDAASWEVMVR